MQNPVSPPKSNRTCPTCSRPVEPGNKYCDTCGTKIPVLLTCSECGTQFIDPIKYCDLCGAPVIQGEVPEPDDTPEPDDIPERSEEETTGLVEDQTPEPDDEEISEPDTDELPEENDEENLVAAEDETPHHYVKEIPEPDTDALLEQYGKEYAEDETLASYHKPKPPASIKHEAKKPVGFSAPQGRVSSETVDDVLFMVSKKPEAAAKAPVNKTRIIIGCIVLAAIIAAVYFIGLPVLTKSGGFSSLINKPAAEIIPLPEPTDAEIIPPARTGTPAPASRALVPLPTQQIPSGQKLYFQVQKNPVTSKISVIFAGSAGEGSIKSADIKVTHPDGSVATGIILPLKGITEITLDGSKETDRVEIIAQMSSGQTYRVRDELVPFMLL